MPPITRSITRALAHARSLSTAASSTIPHTPPAASPGFFSTSLSPTLSLSHASASRLAAQRIRAAFAPGGSHAPARAGWSILSQLAHDLGDDALRSGSDVQPSLALVQTTYLHALLRKGDVWKAKELAVGFARAAVNADKVGRERFPFARRRLPEKTLTSILHMLIYAPSPSSSPTPILQPQQRSPRKTLTFLYLLAHFPTPGARAARMFVAHHARMRDPRLQRLLLALVLGLLSAEMVGAAAVVYVQWCRSWAAYEDRQRLEEVERMKQLQEVPKERIVDLRTQLRWRSERVLDDPLLPLMRPSTRARPVPELDRRILDEIRDRLRSPFSEGTYSEHSNAAVQLASLLDDRLFLSSRAAPLLHALINFPPPPLRSHNERQFDACKYIREVLQRFLVDPPVKPPLEVTHSEVLPVHLRALARLPPREGRIPLRWTMPQFDTRSYNTLLHYALRHKRDLERGFAVLRHMTLTRNPSLRPRTETLNVLVREGSLMRVNSVTKQALAKFRSRLVDLDAEEAPKGDKRTSRSSASNRGTAQAPVVGVHSSTAKSRPSEAPAVVEVAPATERRSRRRRERPAKAPHVVPSPPPPSRPNSLPSSDPVLASPTEHAPPSPLASDPLPDMHTFSAYITHLSATGQTELLMPIVFRLLPQIDFNLSWHKRRKMTYTRRAIDPHLWTSLLSALARADKAGLATRVWRQAKWAEEGADWTLPIEAFTAMLQLYCREVRKTVVPDATATPAGHTRGAFAKGWGPQRWRYDIPPHRHKPDAPEACRQNLRHSLRPNAAVQAGRYILEDVKARGLTLDARFFRYALELFEGRPQPQAKAALEEVREMMRMGGWEVPEERWRTMGGGSGRLRRPAVRQTRSLWRTRGPHRLWAEARRRDRARRAEQ